MIQMDNKLLLFLINLLKVIIPKKERVPLETACRVFLITKPRIKSVIVILVCPYLQVLVGYVSSPKFVIEIILAQILYREVMSISLGV